MINKMFLSCVAFSLLLCSFSANAEKIWQENNKGYVLFEAEATESSLGSCWKLMKPAGFTGTGALEMTCNTASGGTPKQPLVYKFKISEAGDYTLYLDIYKNLQGATSDLCNDVYVKVTGDYSAATGGAPLTDLQEDNKLYGGSPTACAWTGDKSLDVNDVKKTPKYAFKAGQTYTLTMSGRSQRCNVNRITFTTIAAKVTAQDAATPDSPTSAVTPTCTDGIKNGDETGIDCGGSCPKACPVVAPTCTDGIKNGDETGVDCGGSCPACGVTPTCSETHTYAALTDFTIMPATGDFVTYYKHTATSALAINAATTANRGKWAAAEVTFDGVDCTYDFKLTGLCELDGETSYKMYVNGVQIGTTMKNDRIQGTSKPDYTPQVHTVKGVTIKKGDKIRVESNCASNSLVPEGTGFAWARGRWTQLQLVPGTTTAVIQSVALTAVPSSVIYANGNLTFTAPSAGKYTVSLFSVSGKLLATHAVSATGSGRTTVSLIGSKLKGTFIAAVKGTGFSVSKRIVM